MTTPQEPLRPGLAALHITTLFTLSVAQPLYSLYSQADHITFFVAHQAKAIDIWLFVGVISLFLPIGIISIIWIMSLLSRNLARWSFSLVFFTLIAALTLPASARLFPESGDLTVAVGLGVSAIATLLYLYKNWVRFFFTLLSMSIILSPFIFLTSTPIRSFLSAPENQEYEIISKAGKYPNIFMLVFDELPLTSLLDSTRSIDKVRFPNFYRLAQNSTWYRNAAATDSITRAAIPRMLTGVFDRSLIQDEENTESMFTLLSATHRIVAMEHATRLAQAVNDKSTPTPNLGFRFASEFKDIALVYAHLVFPKPLQSKLPVIDNQWNHFSIEAVPFHEQDPPWPYQGHWPRKLRSFLALLEQDIYPPKFYFFHLLMPHQPFNYDHEGRMHSYELPKVVKELSGQNEFSSKYKATLIYQAHLLDLSFGDRLLGHIFQRLDELSLFDSSLLIITADHGISFYWDDAGDQKLLNRIQTEDLANIPLFIKLPNQREGNISEVPIQTHDILPTVANILGIEVPWKTDGISAHEIPSKRKRTAYLPKMVQIDSLMDPDYRSLHRKLELFGQGFDGLYNYGPHGELVGRSVDHFSVEASANILEITDLNKFRDLRLSSIKLPAYVEGKITSQSGNSSELTYENLALAVAVNGIIRVTTQPWFDDNGLYFLCRLPPKSLKEGTNEIDVYAVATDEDNTATSLASFVNTFDE